MTRSTVDGVVTSAGHTKREVAEKVARLERERQSGYVGDRPVTVAEWLDAWIESKVTAATRARTLEWYLLDRRHSLR